MSINPYNRKELEYILPIMGNKIKINKQNNINQVYNYGNTSQTLTNNSIPRSFFEK